ncbi:unnamed protein product [Schistosoma margrebowiei]|uniref:Uncharacterized protein n=1 Tax=Schistosoma margrebowiei TaxID=48269 RepID=A0A183MH50_9TREM|nr:unnamed protein product [Schistosoma margrebowiei]
MFTKKNRRTVQTPELLPHYAKTHSDDEFKGNGYRIDLLLDLELAKVILAQIERDIELERLRQDGREHYNQVVADRVMLYEPTSVSRAVGVPPERNCITIICKV